MKKTIITLLLSLAAILNTNAYDAKVNGIYYNLDHTNYTAEVTNYGNLKDNTVAYSGKVIIPSSILYNGRSYNVTTIGTNAFYGCKSLNSVYIPNSVTSIERMAFYDCSVEHVSIGNSVTDIGIAAFSTCRSLRHVSMGESLTTVGVMAFDNCHLLSSLTFPNTVTHLGSGAFSSCSSLATVTLGPSVRTVEEANFSCCYNLYEINCKNAVPPVCRGDEFSDVDTDKCLLHVPVGCKDAYASATGWRNFKNIIDDIIDQEQLKEEIATLTQANETLTQEVETLNKANTALARVNNIQKRQISIQETENETLRHRLETGDMDGNGVTTAADVAKVVQAALTQTEPQVTEE